MRGALIIGPPTGGGGPSTGDNFGKENFLRGNFRHNCNFGVGPSDTGTFHSPNPWFLVDNQSCETLASEIKLNLYPLGPPPDELQKILYQGSIFIVQQKWMDTEDAQRAGRGPNCANFCGDNFDTNPKNEVVPTNLPPDEVLALPFFCSMAPSYPIPLPLVRFTVA